MTPNQIIRAWKDAEFRASLSPAHREQLPENPAGLVELSDADLGHVAGGKETVAGFCAQASMANCTAHCSSWGCDSIHQCGIPAITSDAIVCP